MHNVQLIGYSFAPESQGSGTCVAPGVDHDMGLVGGHLLPCSSAAPPC